MSSVDVASQVVSDWKVACIMDDKRALGLWLCVVEASHTGQVLGSPVTGSTGLWSFWFITRFGITLDSSCMAFFSLIRFLALGEKNPHEIYYT